MEENKKVIKSLSTVLNDGTLSEGIPFGAKAENIELDNGKFLSDMFDSEQEIVYSYTFNEGEYDNQITLDTPLDMGSAYDVYYGPYTFKGLYLQEFQEGPYTIPVLLTDGDPNSTTGPFIFMDATNLMGIAVMQIHGPEYELYPTEWPIKVEIRKSSYKIKEGYLPNSNDEIVFSGETFEEVKEKFENYWKENFEDGTMAGMSLVMQWSAGEIKPKMSFKIADLGNFPIYRLGEYNAELNSGMNDNIMFAFYSDPITSGTWLGEGVKSKSYVVALPVYGGLRSSTEYPTLWTPEEIDLTGYNKPSWEISNPDHVNYIQNRPFYSEEGLKAQLSIPSSIDSTTYKGVSTGMDPVFHYDAPFTIEPGKSYYANGTIISADDFGQLDLSNIPDHGTALWISTAEGEFRVGVETDSSENNYISATVLTIEPANPITKKIDGKLLTMGVPFIDKKESSTILEGLTATWNQATFIIDEYNCRPYVISCTTEQANLIKVGSYYEISINGESLFEGMLKDYSSEAGHYKHYVMGNPRLAFMTGINESSPDTGEKFAVEIYAENEEDSLIVGITIDRRVLEKENLENISFIERELVYNKIDTKLLPNSLVREWLPYKEYYKDTPVHKDGSIYKALETFTEDSEINPVKGSIEEITPTEGMQIRGEGVIRPDWSFFENISDADLFNYIIADGFTISASEAMEDDIETGVDLTSASYRFHNIFDSSMGRFTHLISSDEDSFQDVIMCIPNEYITESGKISIEIFTSPVAETFTWYMMMMQDIVLDENGQFVSGTRYPKEYISEAMGISFKTNDFVVDTITSVSDHFSDSFKILKTVQNPKWELLHTHFIDGQFNDDEIIQYYDNILNKENGGYETARTNVKPGSIIFNTKGGYKNVHFSIYLGGGNS